MELVLIFLGPVDDDGRLPELIRRVGDSFGPEVSFPNRPSNDYLQARRAGEFPAVLDVAEQLTKLVDSGNVHFETPGVWNFSLLVLYGRRVLGENPADIRSKVTSEARLSIEIASYDRLTDGQIVTRRQR
jgi:hypothetical protein